MEIGPQRALGILILGRSDISVAMMCDFYEFLEIEPHPRGATHNMLEISDLPLVNASLNTISAAFLVAGYVNIRRRWIAAHRTCMLGAVASSSLFLVSYLVYHYSHGSTPFTGEGWTRYVYFTILISHVILATAMVPMIVLTLRHALKGRFERHAPLARWTLPIWLYVSVTGLLVYLMLYQWQG